MADNTTYDKPLKITKLAMFDRYSGKPEWVDGKPIADKLTWSIMNGTYLSFTVWLKNMGGRINHSIYITEFVGIFDKVKELYLSGDSGTIQYNLSRDYFSGGTKTTVNTSVIFGVTDGTAWIGFVREGLPKVKFDFTMVGANELVKIVKDDKKVENISVYLAAGYISNLIKTAISISNNDIEVDYINTNVGSEERVTTAVNKDKVKEKKPANVGDDDMPF